MLSTMPVYRQFYSDLTSCPLRDYQCRTGISRRVASLKEFCATSCFIFTFANGILMPVGTMYIVFSTSITLRLLQAECSLTATLGRVTLSTFRPGEHTFGATNCLLTFKPALSREFHDMFTLRRVLLCEFLDLFTR